MYFKKLDPVSHSGAGTVAGFTSITDKFTPSKFLPLPVTYETRNLSRADIVGWLDDINY
jgi:hypothetical protein